MVNPQQINITIYPTGTGSLYRVKDAGGTVLDRIIWDGSAQYDVQKVYGAGAWLDYEGPEPS